MKLTDLLLEEDDVRTVLKDIQDARNEYAKAKRELTSARDKLMAALKVARSHSDVAKGGRGDAAKEFDRLMRIKKTGKY